MSVTLEEATKQLVNLGERDPSEIARKVIERHGENWVRDQLYAQASDFLTQYARQQLGSVRRRAELALRPGDEVSRSELLIAKAWVPGVGWKRAAELTPSDLRARASWYDSISDAASRRAEWCRAVAWLMDNEGVSTLGEMKAEFPSLPPAVEVGDQ